MTAIPRDPVALMAARLIIGFMLLLAVLALLPRPASMAAPVQAQAPAPIFVASTATPRPAAPEPPPAVAPVLAAATAAPAGPAVAAVQASDPPPQLVHNADGSVSLPGSEAWLPDQIAVTVADPQLAIERDAAAAYRALPVAAPPSAENAQPVTARRPHTGR